MTRAATRMASIVITLLNMASGVMILGLALAFAVHRRRRNR